jgi:N-methylhydantoinase B/oxoprolinase/acetone carboxylase alpha subunit
MPQGLALTIGLNSVDPAHYGGWSGELRACEADAEDMAEIAKTRHFTVKTLLTASATRAKVISEMNQAATTLQSGDIFVLSYSGHGGQVPDLNRDELDDRKDETWCLYDGQSMMKPTIYWENLRQVSAS